MTKEIKKAVVIGAGVMGAGIAAQLANAGIEVELLDIVPKKLEAGQDRSIVAQNAVQKMLKDKPAPFMHKRNSKRIRPGNTEDHMDRLKDADLIIEAVVENPKIKSNLFKKIDAHRKAGSIIGSNTSTIPLKTLADGQSDSVKKDLVITHFFNPPRYMPLLEIISSAENNPDTVKKLADFMDAKMGKTVIHCNDTPGFIANRVGTYWITVAMKEARKLKLTPEEADAIGGKPMGIPKTGVFALVDMVGLDLIPHISDSLIKNVPSNDDYLKQHEDIALIQKMIKDGYTGRKGKGGFYRMNKTADGEKQLQVVDLYQDEPSYSDVKEPRAKSFKRAKKGGLRALVSAKDKEGQYAWNVLKKTLTYAAAMIPEIHDDLTAIDDAMKLGYNWKHGPFEMIDKMGVDWFIKKLEADGETVPKFLKEAKGKKFYRTVNGKLEHLTTSGSYKQVKRPDGVLLLSDVKRGSKPVAKNISSALWDIGDGVLCLEFTSIGNSLDPMIMRMMNKAEKIISSSKGKYKALVIHNEGQHFSVGANLKLAEVAGKAKQYWLVEKIVRQGQDTYKKLKFSNFPVIAAPSGMALGGGCEILLHCDHVQAHAETYTGLVEMGVGIIPGWGGCGEVLARAMEDKRLPKGPMPPIAKTFETIAMTKVSASADDAKSIGYFSKNTEITMNKARLLADAKEKALDMVKNGYTPPEPKTFRLPGATGRAALQMAVNDMYKKGLVSSYAVILADQLGSVITGSDKADITVELTEDDLRELEVKVFMQLVHDARTGHRISHMLEHGKALDMNKKFLKEDAKLNVTTKELRQSLKGMTGLDGKLYPKPSKALQKKLQPSFDAAAEAIKKKPSKDKKALFSRKKKKTPKAD